MKRIILTLMLTYLYMWMISFGIILTSVGYLFWGYFNYFVGGLSVYYLSYCIFKQKDKEITK